MMRYSHNSISMEINSKLSVTSGSIMLLLYVVQDSLIEIRNRGVGEWFFEIKATDLITFLLCERKFEKKRFR